MHHFFGDADATIHDDTPFAELARAIAIETLGRAMLIEKFFGNFVPAGRSETLVWFRSDSLKPIEIQFVHLGFLFPERSL